MFAASLILISMISTGNQVRVPVVIELFTSEGCSSCPPADTALLRLWKEQPIDAVEIIPLEFHVDYWNNQGWEDPYSNAENTLRQQEYQHTFGSEDLYTPEAIVDGQAHFVAALNDLRNQAKSARSRPKVEIRMERKPESNGTVVESRFVLPSNFPEPELWIALTESGLSSKVLRGENAGRSLVHAPVVRQISKISIVKGETVGLRLAQVRLSVQSKWKRENLRIVAVLRDPKSLHIVGASSTQF